MRWLPVLVLILLFSSCADLEKQGYLDRIGALDAELASMQDELNGHQIPKAEEKMDFCTTLSEPIKRLESDTIPFAFAKKIDHFMRLCELLPIGIAMQDKLNQEIEDLRADLKKLKTDIENGNGQRHKYDSYIRTEESKLNVISERFKRCRSVQDQLNPEIELAITSLDSVLHEPIPSVEVQ